MQQNLKQSLKTLMIDIQDNKLRDEVLSILTEHNSHDLPACQKPEDAFKISTMFQRTLEKIVNALKNTIDDKKRTEVLNSQQIKQIEE